MASDSSIWLAILLAALGTCLTRVLPWWWMRWKRQQGVEQQGSSVWLHRLGPLMIAALLGASLVPAQRSSLTWLAVAMGLLLTWLVWWWRRSLGLPVLVGVVTFGLSQFWFSSVLAGGM